MPEIEFKAILHHLPLGVALMRKDLTYEFVNEKYAEMLGRPAAEIIGRNMRDVVPEKILKDAEPFLQSALNGKSATFQVRDAGTLTVKSPDVIYIPLGAGNGFLAVFSQERVREKYFKLGIEVTVTTLNHHINNALTILLGKLSHAEETAILKEVQEDLGRIRASAERITKTLKSLKDLESLTLKDYSDFSDGVQYFDFRDDKEKG